MPATEKTWRDQNVLHVIFAVSGLLMLATTVWMLAADHYREWKVTQRKTRRIDTAEIQWRQLQEQTDAKVQGQQELQDDIDAARRKPPAQALLDEFQREVARDAELRSAGAYDFSDVDASYTSLTEAAEQVDPEQPATLNRASDDRDSLLENLRVVFDAATFREDRALGERKAHVSQYDAARAARDLAVRDGAAGDVLKSFQDRVDTLKEKLDVLTERMQDTADHRKELQAILAQITAGEDAAVKALDDDRAALDQLVTSYQDRRPSWTKWLIELPVVDAFNSPLSIDNKWYPKLTFYNNFRDVARYDRCMTCHQAMEKTLPGSAVDPAHELQHELIATLVIGDEEDGDVSTEASDDDNPEDTLEKRYGIRLAEQGLIDRDDVAIRLVLPSTPAARARIGGVRQASASSVLAEEIEDAVMDPQSDLTVTGAKGLLVGDVILEINETKVQAREQAVRLLGIALGQDEPLTLTIARGLPNPFGSHPRLDLFVGSTSPHPVPLMGCTICHEGQGSGTAFKWTSHTPDDEKTRVRWTREHGWFDNHHWIFPMNPKRFAQSSCLKCHHEVNELEASDRFPDEPAPKLLRGHTLIKQFGCYGCHEINGYDGPDKRIGPDLRLEPNVYGAALQIKSDTGFDSLGESEKGYVEQLIHHPERDEIRRRLLETLLDDEKSDEPTLSSASHTMSSLLKDVEAAGTQRKVGPSLRFVSKKLDPAFLFDWVLNPQHFRPKTRMPRIFGLTDHLIGDDGQDEAVQTTQQYEQVEALGIVTYLLNRSRNQPFEYLPVREGIAQSTNAEKIARGRERFQFQCLGCHQHSDFPEARTSGNGHGPDLSRIGDKLAARQSPDGSQQPDGRKWLYSWLVDPTHYHARPLMPNTKLEPIKGAEGKLTDPADEIAEYLLSTATGWKPKVARLPRTTDGPLKDVLDDLTLEHLSAAYSGRIARDYLKRGIPESLRPDKGAEVEMVGPITDEKKLLYVGRRAITKYGCFACHDIPGFEDAKPIGTTLADWGRKEPSKLAFEHIARYLHGHGGHGHGGHGHGGNGEAGDEDESGETTAAEEPTEPFYTRAIESHNRIGFLYQKLRAPRSYDYLKTENKGYNERLRMPQFPLDAEQREAIMTFVLGLVSEPPAGEYVYQPDARRKAIVQGRQVLEKYNCGGCHILKMERWKLAYHAGDFRAQPVPNPPNYPFLTSHFSQEQAEQATVADRRGLLSATLQGIPSISNDNGRPLVVDEEGDNIESGEMYDPSTLEFRFELWEPVMLAGPGDASAGDDSPEASYTPLPHSVGVVPMVVPASTIEKRYPAEGGDLVRLLLGPAIALEKQTNPNANGSEAWGWLPPPLHGQGRKVQSEWLYDFLLDPQRIRPAVMLRMPKFNLSPDEAAKLVAYFAAVDDVDAYEFDDRSRNAHLAAGDAKYEEVFDRLSRAMKIVVGNDYCVKCHAVSDFQPGGSQRAKGPDLARVHRRLRPEFVRRWIGNPKSVLPYTGMPVNIPYNPGAPGIPVAVYDGTSVEQLEALVDLIVNFDFYTNAHTRIAPLVQPAPAPAAAAAPPAPAATVGQAAGTEN